ncbi:MAG: hypothetical protein AAF645_17455 [Myxococcota bacterium]
MRFGLLAMAAACTISSPSLEGRACPCADGFRCVDGVCIALSDGASFADGAVDGLPDDSAEDSPSNTDARMLDVAPDEARIDMTVPDVAMPDRAMPDRAVDMAPACATRESICTDEMDDDCDGNTDCEDPDCRCSAGAIAVHDALLPPAPAVGPSLRLNVPAPATRYVNTSSDSMSRSLRRGDGTFTGPLASGPPARLSTGAWGAVWFNAVSVMADAPGFVKMWRSGSAEPDEPILNFSGAVNADSSITPVGSSRELLLTTNRVTPLILDLLGTFTTSGGLGLRMLATPNRFETRGGSRPPLRTSTRVSLGSAVGSAVVFTATSVDSLGRGFLRFQPCSGPEPEQISHINYDGSRASNLVVAPIAGGLCAFTAGLSQTHIVVDTVAELSSSIRTRYQPVRVSRLVDTRSSQRDRETAWTGLVGANQELNVDVSSIPEIPSNIDSVVVRVTVVFPPEEVSPRSGEAYVYACGSSPGFPDLAFPGSGTTHASLALSGLSPDGRLCFYSTVRAHLVLSLVGAWVDG